MEAKTAHLPTPDLTIDEAGTVRSASFGDVYFSREGGAAETDHVFLRGNDLPQRWEKQDSFTIGELGFGTGLNFLVAMETFLKTNAHGRLHFFSVEKFPLTKAQLAQLHGADHELVKNYPDRLPGWHRVHFGRATLTLGFGDAAELLSELQARADAWFLDGFAPAKNPDMWSENIFQEIARLSAHGASFATFTSAGAVKRGLEAQGFAVEKVKGFGSKRDMLVGRLKDRCVGFHPEPPRSVGGQRGHAPLSINVIGAGIAGATVAHALATRGIHVTVLEQHTIAAGASGNRAAVLYPQLTKYYGAATQWHFTGYGLARRLLQQAPVGMLKIGKDEEGEKKLREALASLQLDEGIARWIDADEASQKLGTKIGHGGVWFEQGTWLDPRAWCKRLLSHPRITVQENTPGTIDGPTVVATAHEAAKLLPSLPMAIGISAGQVTRVKSDIPLRAILCHKGYAIPQAEGLLIGATYDHHDFSGSVTERNHAENIAALQKYLSGDYPVLGGRTRLRATTPDRLPYVGQVEDDVWVSVGHGSRGMISAPLAAEVIASHICGEPLPVGKTLLQAIDPFRHHAAKVAVTPKPSRANTGA